MDDEIEHLEMTCPNCQTDQHSRSQPCTAYCDDGMVDDNDEDPVNSPMGSFYPCPTCRGKGCHHWCTKCGYEFTAVDFERDRKENPNGE